MLYCFLSLYQLSTFCLLCFQCREISLRVPLMYFYQHHFFWNTLIFFFTTKSLLCISKFFLSSSGCIPTVCWTTMVSICLWSATSSITLFMFNLNITYSIITFCFFTACSFFLANSLFRLSIFIKCHVGLSRGDMEATKLHTLLSVQELSNRCAMTNP